MTSLGTLITTWMSGKLVGTDDGGNRYYTEKSAPKDRRAKRWVIYNGDVEATKVPPEWHAWLHYTSDAPLTSGSEPWRKAPETNKTGTAEAYLPPGHDLRGGRRERAAGDYEAWAP
ncbi:MAG: NADH:ubiquinone oxidoreductase subunit NDUFA12 [Pseudomonadota bacterium]